MFKGIRFRDALVAFLCLIGIITVFQYASSFAVLILSTLSAWWGRLLLAFAALGVASVLFYIREVHRFEYALMELTFGIVSTWYAIATLTSEQTQWPVVVGAIYLIVRGLDNLKEGLKRRMIAWRRKSMDGTPEEHEKFLKSLFHGARFNGRIMILAAASQKKTQQEMLDMLRSKVMAGAARQADETGFDARQKEIYLEPHRKAYDSLADEFGLN